MQTVEITQGGVYVVVLSQDEYDRLSADLRREIDRDLADKRKEELEEWQQMRSFTKKRNLFRKTEAGRFYDAYKGKRLILKSFVECAYASDEFDGALSGLRDMWEEAAIEGRTGLGPKNKEKLYAALAEYEARLATNV